MLFTRRLTIVGKTARYGTGENHWLLALYFNIIQRNQTGIDYLVTVENEVFAQSELGAQIRPFEFAMVDLYKAMLTKGEVGSELIHAMTTFNPDEYEDAAFAYASRLDWPQVAIIRAIFTEDGEAQYNEAMEQALLLHKEFYDVPDERGSFRGGLPIPLIALAAFAADTKGYKLTIETDYLPDWMIYID